MSKTSQARLSATLHLSVVPRSAVSHGKERHLVAAIQFAATMESWQLKRIWTCQNGQNVIGQMMCTEVFITESDRKLDKLEQTIWKWWGQSSKMWHHMSESQDESKEADTGAVGFETFKVPTCTAVP